MSPQKKTGSINTKPQFFHYSQGATPGRSNSSKESSYFVSNGNLNGLTSFNSSSQSQQQDFCQFHQFQQQNFHQGLYFEGPISLPNNDSLLYPTENQVPQQKNTPINCNLEYTNNFTSSVHIPLDGILNMQSKESRDISENGNIYKNLFEGMKDWDSTEDQLFNSTFRSPQQDSYQFHQLQQQNFHQELYFVGPISQPNNDSLLYFTENQVPQQKNMPLNCNSDCISNFTSSVEIPLDNIINMPSKELRDLSSGNKKKNLARNKKVVTLKEYSDRIEKEMESGVSIEDAANNILPKNLPISSKYSVLSNVSLNLFGKVIGDFRRDIRNFNKIQSNKKIKPGKYFELEEEFNRMLEFGSTMDDVYNAIIPKKIPKSAKYKILKNLKLKFPDKAIIRKTKHFKIKTSLEDCIKSGGSIEDAIKLIPIDFPVTSKYDILNKLKLKYFGKNTLNI